MTMHHTYPIVFKKSGFYPTLTSKLGKSLRKERASNFLLPKLSVVLQPVLLR